MLHLHSLLLEYTTINDSSDWNGTSTMITESTYSSINVTDDGNITTQSMIPTTEESLDTIVPPVITTIEPIVYPVHHDVVIDIDLPTYHWITGFTIYFTEGVMLEVSDQSLSVETYGEGTVVLNEV